MHGRVGADRLITVDDSGTAAFLRNLHGQDLGREPASLGRLHRPAMALHRILVLRAAPDLVLGGDDFARVPHVALLERAPQAVVDHRIERLAVAHAHPFAQPA